MIVTALLVLMIVAAVGVGAWASPPRAPSPDHGRDLDMRRSLWR